MITQYHMNKYFDNLFKKGQVTMKMKLIPICQCLMSPPLIRKTKYIWDQKYLWVPKYIYGV
jgi:hypothetical protein